MAETKINVNQTNITADNIDAIPQYSSMPTAGADNLGDIVQFTGTTDATYTNGYFYKCVSDGQVPPTYSWTQIDVQPSSGGGGLPDQTGNAGKFLTTDGTDASWSNKMLVNGALQKESFATPSSLASNKSATTCIGVYSSAGGGAYSTYGCSAYGHHTSVLGAYNTAIGSNTSAGYGHGSVTTQANGNVAIGYGVKAGTTSGVHDAILIGSSKNYATLSTSDTFAIIQSTGVIVVIGPNGLMPPARLASTTGLADGNYRLQLTVSSGVATLSWVAE